MIKFNHDGNTFEEVFGFGSEEELKKLDKQLVETCKKFLEIQKTSQGMEFLIKELVEEDNLALLIFLEDALTNHCGVGIAIGALEKPEWLKEKEKKKKKKKKDEKITMDNVSSLLH